MVESAAEASRLTKESVRARSYAIEGGVAGDEDFSYRREVDRAGVQLRVIGVLENHTVPSR